MTMKKKDIIEGKIIKTEFPNKGTFICEDQKVTVKGVIDGQTIKGHKLLLIYQEMLFHYLS